MFHFIYNPIAGSGKSAHFRAVLEDKLRSSGIPFIFHESRFPKQSVQIARMLTSEINGEEPIDIVAMGGDGTLNEVLNGIVEPSRVRLGIIPCGSGNDFAVVAGIPIDPAGSLETLLRSEARYTDYMECSGVRGLNAIGTGIDVDILRRFNRMKLLKGSAAYLASLIITLFSYRARRFTEIVDVESREHRAFIACAGNGQRIGGGIPICPEAAIDDGLLDIVIVDNVRFTAIPGAFSKLMKRRILELPSTSFRRDTRLRIVSDTPMPIQIDGEIYENLPFDVRVVSNSLRVYRP